MDPTPKMREALRKLALGETLDFERTQIGRPTKQRLAKYGFAEYLEADGNWDGPMRITRDGLKLLDAHTRQKLADQQRT